MGRLIVLLLLACVAVWYLRRVVRRFEGEDHEPRDGAPVRDLVSCARCGVHVPRPEAREAGGALYCSEEHARLGPAPRR